VENKEELCGDKMKERTSVRSSVNGKKWLRIRWYQ
jgi:hypothetical protein